jgi:hypothetical protein
VQRHQASARNAQCSRGTIMQEVLEL